MEAAPREPSPEVRAASALAAEALGNLQHSDAFRNLDSQHRAALLTDLATITQALASDAPHSQVTATSLGTPNDLRRRMYGATDPSTAQPSTTPAPVPADASAPAARPPATETLARRVGALVDEVDFPAFVAGLVHGTFDAVVDASIRQMEEFAELVSSVAKSVEDFTRDNVTPNQVRDWLVQQHPSDVRLEFSSGAPRVVPAKAPAQGGDGDEEVDVDAGTEGAPGWLTGYGLSRSDFTPARLDDVLIPAASRTYGENRLQLLATMVLLGMNRVVVRDGRIAAKVRFRAAALDKANVAVAQDSGQPSWGERGTASGMSHQTMVSTVGVNVQSDTDVKAELFGEVEINFASETLPLDRFVDQARLSVLQRHSRTAAPSGAATPAAAPAAAPLAPAPIAPPAAPPALPAPTTTPEGAPR